MSREPARERYDAAVDVFPFHGKEVQFGFGLAKFTFTIGDRVLLPADPEPLAHDIRPPDTPHFLKPGSDFWPEKPASDVVVLGSAYASQPVRHMKVSISVGNAAKRIEVFGRRVVGWKGSTPRFSEAEPFQEMPIVNTNAYGGVDGRVPVPKSESIADDLRLEFDHPGVYPRNPFGKGYLVLPDPVEGVELPNLEYPGDRLTPERLIVHDPRHWHRQPLPWSLDHHHPMMFPRYVYFGADAWFTPPQDATLAEIRNGWLVPNYRQRYPSTSMIDGLEAPREFFQEASLGLSFAELAPGTPVGIWGMHPQGKPLRFSIPEPPRMKLALEGRVESVRPHLATVLIEPTDERVCFTYVGILRDLPRVFIPGVHGKIPLVLCVDDDPPLVYEAPPTVRSQLQAKEAES